MRRLGSIVWLLATVVSTPIDASDLFSAHTLCDCIKTKPGTFEGSRDGDHSFSMIVPDGYAALSTDHDFGHDGIRWTGPDAQLGFSHGSDLIIAPAFDDPAENECVVRLGKLRVLVQDGPRVWHIQLEEPTNDWSRQPALWIETESVPHACELAAAALWSLEFNLLDRLRVATVAEDLQSFVYLDAVGSQRRAARGDRIGWDHGIVKDIRRDAIVIAALVPDGSGGWREVERVLDVVR